VRRDAAPRGQQGPQGADRSRLVCVQYAAVEPAGGGARDVSDGELQWRVRALRLRFGRWVHTTGLASTRVYIYFPGSEAMEGVIKLARQVLLFMFDSRGYID
jgi:hypothetical protein